MAWNILVVDDEKALRDVMRLFLETEGFSVSEAESGEQALELFRKNGADLVVLDVMLPGISGYEVCKSIRESSEVPIIFLTALEDDEHHMLGYRVGADDYIPKPLFKPSILVLKVKRILGRQLPDEKTNILELGPVRLDPDNRSCLVDGDEIILTKTEFNLIWKFIENPGRVFTRENLLHSIWGYEYAGDMRAVDAMIKKLRKKLGPAAGMLKTVVGVGYKLELK